MKKMNKIVVLALCLAIGKLTYAQQALSLKQCIETAIANNIDVLTATNTADRSNIDKQQAKLNQLPNFNAAVSPSVNMGRSIDPFTNTYTDQKNNNTSFGLNGGINLFNGLTLQSSIKQTAAVWKASKAGIQQQIDNIKIGVILAYLQVLSNQELILQANKQFELSGQQVKRMTILDNEGSIKPSELSDLKGQVANDQLSIITLKNSLTSSFIELCRLMNMPYNTSMAVENLNTDSLMLDYAVDKNKLYKTALTNLAQIKALDLNTEAARWGVRAQKGKLYPTLRFDSYLNTYYSSVASTNVLINSGIAPSDDFVIIGGQNIAVNKLFTNYNAKHIPNFEQFKNNRYGNFILTLQLPVFNNFRARNNIKLAKIDYKEAQQQAAAGKTQLQLDVEQAYQNVTTGSDRYNTLLQQTKHYQQSFNAATSRFDEGVGNSIDYLTAKNNLDRANSNLISARYDFILRTKILDFYQGKSLW